MRWRKGGGVEMAKTTSFLRNRYWVLRHVKSIPNERCIIVSSMENDTCPEYQLAPEGVMENLRERFFDPSYELLSHDKYHDIWAFDDKNPLTRPAEGGESVGDVACRLAEAMEIMESQFQGHFGIAET